MASILESDHWIILANQAFSQKPTLNRVVAIFERLENSEDTTDWLILETRHLGRSGEVSTLAGGEWFVAKHGMRLIERTSGKFQISYNNIMVIRYLLQYDGQNLIDNRITRGEPALKLHYRRNFFSL